MLFFCQAVGGQKTNFLAVVVDWSLLLGKKARMQISRHRYFSRESFLGTGKTIR